MVNTVNIDTEIAEVHMKEVALLLNTLLADEYVLTTKTRNAHWNIQGQNFTALHTFFESQYNTLDIIIDNVAERVRALGHFALGSLKDFIAITRLSEHNHDNADCSHVIQTLLQDHATLIQLLRKDISEIAKEDEDLGTVDFLTGLLEQHEKMAWMLRAHLT